MHDDDNDDDTWNGFRNMFNIANMQILISSCIYKIIVQDIKLLNLIITINNQQQKQRKKFPYCYQKTNKKKKSYENNFELPSMMHKCLATRRNRIYRRPMTNISVCLCVFSYLIDNFLPKTIQNGSSPTFLSFILASFSS